MELMTQMMQFLAHPILRAGLRCARLILKYLTSNPVNRAWYPLSSYTDDWPAYATRSEVSSMSLAKT
ncbi:protein of unknown function [Methylocaldum szegediense]|uniref:Uncharacterized protein n=1 Tax=Methylocaldum szegediense TaxID=73780 RepID=A0ABM9I782_9GAMM|nr:protein of unknown function [Methylocaldum szegediense]